MKYRTATSTLFLFTFAYVLFFHHLDQRDLWSSHEAQAAQDAQMILDTGDWVLPRLYDGRVEMQKPPLYYWLVASVARLRGAPVEAIAVRLPSAIAAVLGMVVLVLIGWHGGRLRAGILAGLILGTMVHYTWLGRTGRIDMPLTCTTCLALLGYYLGAASTVRSSAWLVLLYVGVGLGVLFKGPLGAVLPVLVIAGHFLVTGEASRPWQWGRRLGLAWGVPLVVAMACPWFWLANERTHGQFMQSFFWRHNVERGFGGDPDLDANPDAIWFYLLRLAPDLFPWCLLLPVALFHAIRRRFLTDDPEARFGMVWFGTILIFFSLMRFKRADYLLPAYPGGALFLGAFLDRWLSKLGERAQRCVGLGIGGTVVAIGVGWMAWVDVYLPVHEPCHELRTFAAEVRRHVPAPGQVVLFRAEGHLLGFHLGRPYERIIEWENLDVWACQPAAVYVIMPQKEFDLWKERLESGRLQRLVSTNELADGMHAEPLVLCVTGGEASVGNDKLAVVTAPAAE